ncbi:hypothetical protein NT6N_35490 [Oceaniferula spumae]|uniref:Uncharacterized protein n=1 Tax=Oceaniferula spumae TaxID=2979115 RepID=A0AAT9FRI7_9BACT
MKRLLIAALLSTSAVQADDESANYLNFIIQIQNNAPLTTHKIDDITPVGNGTALKGVETSSTFQLWTIHRTTGAEYLLDEKIVSSYHPEVEITITSADPYEAIPRTRVDHPFEVRYKVTGLKSNDEDAPDSSKSIIINHVATTYDTTDGYGNAQAMNSANRIWNNDNLEVGLGLGLGLGLGGGDDGGGLLGGLTNGLGGIFDSLLSVVLPQQTIDKNGLTKQTRLTSIQADDLTTAAGEEVFTAMAHPDYGVAEPSMLGTAKVQVWPIAQGSLSGFQPGVEYNRIPDIQVALKDLYPASTTYVRAYKGNPTDNPSDPIIINSSYVILNDSVPGDRQYALTGLDNFITEAGTYTLEILHETPFGVDLLAQSSGLVKKVGLRVIGNLNTSE